MFDQPKTYCNTILLRVILDLSKELTEIFVMVDAPNLIIRLCEFNLDFTDRVCMS